MKKIISILLIACIAASFAACNKESISNSISPDISTDTTTPPTVSSTNNSNLPMDVYVTINGKQQRLADLKNVTIYSSGEGGYYLVDVDVQNLVVSRICENTIQLAVESTYVPEGTIYGKEFMLYVFEKLDDSTKSNFGSEMVEQVGDVRYYKPHMNTYLAEKPLGKGNVYVAVQTYLENESEYEQAKQDFNQILKGLKIGKVQQNYPYDDLTIEQVTEIAIGKYFTLSPSNSNMSWANIARSYIDVVYEKTDEEFETLDIDIDENYVYWKSEYEKGTERFSDTKDNLVGYCEPDYDENIQYYFDAQTAFIKIDADELEWAKIEKLLGYNPQ